jgi:hypothetical protein
MNSGIDSDEFRDYEASENLYFIVCHVTEVAKTKISWHRLCLTSNMSQSSVSSYSIAALFWVYSAARKKTALP